MGVSYSDFWKMTPSEIESVLKFAAEKAKAEQKNDVLNAAFTAYHSGIFAHCARMPGTLVQAFPTLFGRTADGQVKAENWKASKMAMAARVAAFNAAKKSKEQFGGRR